MKIFTQVYTEAEPIFLEYSVCYPRFVFFPRDEESSDTAFGHQDGKTFYDLCKAR